MSTIKNVYTSSNALITTGLNSLATSSTVGVISAEVDNTSNLYLDVLVQAQMKGTTAGSPTGTVDVYALASFDGTVYSGDVSTYSGTAGSYTLGAAASMNLALLGSVKIIANTNLYTGPAWSLASAFGQMPPWWAIVVINNCGIALNSTGSSVNWVGVTNQVV